MSLQVKTLFAFLFTERNGDEGLCGFQGPNGNWIAMVGADWDRVQSLKPIAQEISNASGEPIELVKFSVREPIELVKFSVREPIERIQPEEMNP